MITSPMCATVFRVPRCKVYSWVNTWRNGFDSLSIACKERNSFRLLSSSVRKPQASKSWSRKPIITKGKGDGKKVLSSAANVRGVTDEIVTQVTTNPSIEKTDDIELNQIDRIDFRKLVAEDKNLVERATFLVFDLETTGLKRDGYIIEIGLVDISGGEDSTFHTLVNPGCRVPNANIHGITTKMIREPIVPRTEELIPLLLKFIEGRQKPGGFVVMVAHNARVFDVPFLVNEFARFSYQIPSNWVFLDTLNLARALLKARGENPKGNTNLQALCDRYKIELIDAHSAMGDVNALTLVFQKLTYDLKLTRANLVVDWSFTVNDLNTSSPKKKKESS